MPFISFFDNPVVSATDVRRSASVAALLRLHSAARRPTRAAATQVDRRKLAVEN
jgi:hypothetical protein